MLRHASQEMGSLIYKSDAIKDRSVSLLHSNKNSILKTEELVLALALIVLNNS